MHNNLAEKYTYLRRVFYTRISKARHISDLITPQKTWTKTGNNHLFFKVKESKLVLRTYTKGK